MAAGGAMEAGVIERFTRRFWQVAGRRLRVASGVGDLGDPAIFQAHDPIGTLERDRPV